MEKMKMAKRFQGKVAIVTASTQGIGFGIAERLGLEGASVVVSSRKQKNVDETVVKLKARGSELIGVVCHVSNGQQRKNLINQTIEMRNLKFGKIDVVVSNAAANPSVDSILQTKESVLDKLWDINVKSSILLLQDAASHLQKGSSVVLISSIAGYQPQSSMAMYGVTKTALLGLTKALAAEMAPDTRVNCVAPGFVPTHFAEYITSNDGVRQTIEQNTLLNRLGTTGDMAAAAAFLASDDASYITGETLVVAGGMPSRL
ncbi:LOW QUALITY PROTEIN: short-chain dehydrogenase/reductase SDRA [Citrus clementina]|uniref:LOW QUALITY PROTEIN: short-chain dehydrogenase/reductase SDRA n=1 Tax=Citrus clementina TaxID=85681 RepID=UPI000CED7864|nr:LOW QUALITY PROTEIN: short-chain dehydrogenase/reductase SDRA [Citrus x clementina]